MISTNEIRAACEGSWLLLRSRPEGMSYFDQSLPGFWRSFQVIFLLLPIFVLSAMAERNAIVAEADPSLGAFPENAYWWAKLLGFAASWIALPLVLALLAGPIGLSRTYVPFVVARNWTSLLANMPFLLTAVLYLIGIIPTGIFVLLSITCLVMLLYYSYLVTRIALQTTISLAIAVVALDVVLTLLIGELASRLFA
ncbi:hypothetical protein E1180_05300 [Roseibium denhamense]|uniref:Yip1 domain-containing protein n=1 Tax=Roseibium denhamense TaxID=76305 RepID=A0ABY1P229_9HYPH|nr:hypothetical protein [Roseibium denhamense]MTI04930.1 hypothetical protein [Roseibium denhamense]SMP23338.1 hypothetical protein SAMN06265374_2255 [Roseibium denhamense]